MASARLYKTGVASPTNEKKWTLSAWFKFNKPASGGHMYFASGASSDTNWLQVRASSESLSVSGYSTAWLTTTQVFRDTSAWYHIVIAADSTQGTASNRLKVYVNGSEVTSFGTDNRSSISQDQTWGWNKASVVHNIGGENASGYGDFAMAHCHNVDGTAYTPTTFGETDSTTGIWIPKVSPTVTYGNNGWFLKFDNSANMGLDSSGKGNNLTTGGTIIQNKDTPSNNFAKLNPNDIAGTNDITLANTNLTTMQTGSVGDYGIRATLAATTGKYYWEAKITTFNTLCILPMETRLVANLSDGSPADDLYGVQRYSDTQTNVYNDGTFDQHNTAMWGGITSSDVISFALDLTNGKLFVAKNGAYKNTSGATGDPVNGTNPTFTISDTTKTYTFYTEMRGNDDNGTLVNFGDGYFGTTAVSSAQNPDDGNGIFEYDPPTGYRAWTTKGINAQEYS